MSANNKVYFGSRVYSEGDTIDAPETVATEWVNQGRVRKVAAIRSKPMKAPTPLRPENP